MTDHIKIPVVREFSTCTGERQQIDGYLRVTNAIAAQVVALTDLSARIAALEKWAAQFPPLGVISENGKPVSVTGPVTFAAGGSAPEARPSSGDDGMAERRTLTAERDRLTAQVASLVSPGGINYCAKIEAERDKALADGTTARDELDKALADLGVRTNFEDWRKCHDIVEQQRAIPREREIADCMAELDRLMIPKTDMGGMRFCLLRRIGILTAERDKARAELAAEVEAHEQEKIKHKTALVRKSEIIDERNVARADCATARDERDKALADLKEAKLDAERATPLHHVVRRLFFYP